MKAALLAEEITSDPNLFAGFDGEDSAESSDEKSALEEEMFDWLAESLTESGGLLEPEDSAESGGLIEPEDSTESGDLTALEDLAESLGAAESPDMDLFAEEDDEEEATTGWLDADNFDFEDYTDDKTLADLADAVAQQDIGPVDETLPDWMTGLLSADAEETAPEAAGETAEQAQDALPDWMTEFTVSDQDDRDQADEPIANLFEETADSAPDILDELLDAPEPATPATSGPLPDWLSDIAEDETLVSADEDEIAAVTDWLTLDEEAGAGLNWLTDDKPDEATPTADEALPVEQEQVEDTDWLAEMASLGNEAFTAEDTVEEAPIIESEAPQPEPEGDLFAADWPEETETEMEAEVASTPTPEPEKQESDWLRADSMLSDALEEELPDWLHELGPPVTAESPPEEDAARIPSETLPDWIAQMKPGVTQTGDHLSSAVDLSDVGEPLPDVTGEMIEPELPGWLQDAVGTADADETDVFALDESADLPDWLGLEGDESSVEALLGLDEKSSLDASGEWTEVLQALPPASSIRERLAKADIPDWILALKPDLRAKAETAPEPVQEAGPLSGIRGVIDIEPVIAQPRSNGPWPQFTVTDAQQDQAALLKQLALADHTLVHTTADRISSVWLRLILAALLLAVVLTGLLRSDLLPRAPVSSSLPVEMAYTAVQAAADETVLLAVEYTPALAGELDLQAEMLVDQLAANGSPVVTMSQYAAGTAVAHTLAADRSTLGLVPGESIGLRQLGDCLAAPDACRTLTGRRLDSETQQVLADVGLIIILTGERDSLVNWLEQVGRRSQIPMVAGVTQGLGPVAVPYWNSGQLQGVIAGMPDTAVYQQHLSQPTDVVITRLNAQALAQLLAASLLFVGGLSYGIAGWYTRRNPGKA